MRRLKQSEVVLGVFVALPLLLLELLYLGDAIHGFPAWEHGLSLVAIPAAGIGCALCAVVELLVRSRYPERCWRLPWFSLAGGAMLAALLSIGGWFIPLIRNVPALSYARQEVTWPTGMPGRRYGSGDCSFSVELSGPGNAQRHAFTFACLTWDGTASAGFPMIRLNPLSFARYEGGKIVRIEGSLQAMKDRMASSGLPGPALVGIATDIMAVLHQAAAGDPVGAEQGIVGEIWVTPRGHAHIALGGMLWASAVVVVFVGIAYWTCGGDNPDEDTQEPEQV